MWLDTRADADRLDLLDRHGPEILSKNGIIPYVAPRVRRWLRTGVIDTTRIVRVLAPGGYLAGRLTAAAAGDAICDRTQAHLFGCFDVVAGEWDVDLADRIGLPPAWLPRVVDAAEIVGRLSAAMAERTGLSPVHQSPPAAAMGRADGSPPAASVVGPASKRAGPRLISRSPSTASRPMRTGC